MSDTQTALAGEMARRGLAVPSDDSKNALEAEMKRRGLPVNPAATAVSQEPTFKDYANQAADKVGEYAGKAVDYVKDAWTGDKSRQYDLPELPPMMTESGVTSAKMAAGRDDLRKVDILQKQLGRDLDFGIDDFGNAYVDIPQDLAQKHQIKPGSYYVNRPGASMQDIDDLVTQAAIEAPFIIAGSRLGALGIGGGAALGSVAQDGLANAAGADRDKETFGIDTQAAMISGAVGFGSETIARVAVPFIKKIFNSKNFDINDPQIRKKLTNVGVDLEAIDADWLKRFKAAGRDGLDAEKAARVADASGLPVEVPLSKGDITRDVTDQSLESSAQRGALSERAKNLAVGFREGQNDALLANADQIGQRVGAGRAMDAGTSFEPTGRLLSQQANTLSKMASKAYDEATNLGGTVDLSGVQKFAKGLSKAIGAESIPLDNLAPVKAETERFLKLVSAGGDRVNVKLAAIENYRKALTKLRGDNVGNSTGYAAKQTIDALDNFLDEAVENGIFLGDKTALDQFKKARGLWRQLKQNYDGDGIVAKIIARGEDGRFTVTKSNEEIARLFFGANGIGFKSGALKGARELKGILGEDSPEWRSFKQEAFMRLLRSNEGNNRATNIGTNVFSGDKFSTAVRDAMKNSRELMREIFTPQELGLILQFERAALQATNRVAGAVNYSGSGDKLLAAVNRMTERVPGASYLMLPVRKFIQSANQFADEVALSGALNEGKKKASKAAAEYPRRARGLAGEAAVVATNPASETEQRKYIGQ